MERIKSEYRYVIGDLDALIENWIDEIRYEDKAKEIKREFWIDASQHKVIVKLLMEWKEQKNVDPNNR